MKERPILFSGPMVRAILEGRKTQTRRLVKFPSTGAFVCVQGYWTSQTVDEWWPLVSVDGESTSDGDGNETPMRCPYGKPGDRLWVRETTYIWGRWLKNGLGKTGKQKWRFKIEARSITFDPSHPQVATKNTPKERNMYWKRPSIHVPRWASRMTLEITDVRVERLQSISKADAIAEGIDSPSTAPTNSTPWRNYLVKQPAGAHNFCTPQRSYMSLWDSINGTRSSDSNPWVWAVTFKMVQS